MKISLLPALVLFIVVCGLPVRAQKPAEPAEPPASVSIGEFKPEPVTGPGGGGSWLRLLTSFRSTPAWADGIAFYYDILVQKDGQYRVLSGTARYSNVKAGSHSAVLYMSPSAAARFGAPIAAKVGVGYADEVVQSFDWTAPGASPPKDWSTQYQRYSEQLLPIFLTPFVATEYGKYPDPMAVR